MSSEINYLPLCEDCQGTLGFIIIPESQIGEIQKCAFCKKKKLCKTCRIMSARKGAANG